MADETRMQRPVGAVLHSALLYDFTVWMALFGRERALRENLVRLARVSAGEAVLDVGCGTGTLAIAAKREVGPTGTVYAIDASAEMIARARSKAARAGIDVSFETAAAQSLPFPDARFDAVLCTLMLHHLGRRARGQLAWEVRRVVKAAGRVLLVDFARSTRKRRGFISRLHHGHGHVDLREIVGLLEDAGFTVLDTGAVGVKDLHFALAVPQSSRQIQPTES